MNNGNKWDDKSWQKDFLNMKSHSPSDAKLLNKNYLSPKKRSEVLLAAGECKTWAEIMIRYKEITGYDSGE